MIMRVAARSLRLVMAPRGGVAEVRGMMIERPALPDRHGQCALDGHRDGDNDQQQ
jgi:hypothetical protein